MLKRRLIIVFFFTLIATPKVYFVGTPIYLGDILIPIFLLFFLSQVNKPSQINIIMTYFIIIFILFISSLVSYLKYNTVDIFAIFLGVKRFTYIFALYLYGENILTNKNKNWTLDVSILETLTKISTIPLIFSLVELILFFFFQIEIPQVFAVDFDKTSYNSTFLPIGFTGRVFDGNQFVIVGSTSITYGIFNVFFAGLSILLYNFNRKNIYIIFASLFLVGALLSRSSSVMISLIFTAISLIYTLKFNFKQLFILCLFIIIIFSFIDLSSIFTDFLDTFNSVFQGSNAEYDSVNLRIETYFRVFKAIIADPTLLIFGSGYGIYMAKALNYNDPLIESFFIESFFGVGLVGLVCIFYFLILLYRKIKYHNNNNSLQRVYFAKYYLTWFYLLLFLNSFTGNIYSNEFFGSVFFFLIGIL